MIIFDEEHSCTDTKQEQNKKNRLSALPQVGGMMGGGDEVSLHRLSAILLLLFHLKALIVSETGEEKRE